MPIFGVWFQDWDPARIFMFYCLETILVGIFHAIKMAIIFSMGERGAPVKNKAKLFSGGLFFILFFLLHYGIFVFVQTGLFFSVSGIYEGDLFGMKRTQIKSLLGPEGLAMMGIFAFYYLVDIFRDLKNYQANSAADTVKLMFEPYGRVFIQQFALIIGCFFLLFKLENIFIVIFVLIRCYIEVVFNWKKKMADAIDERQTTEGNKY